MSSEEIKSKVGILNFHFANNYGAVLVPFSLKKAVESLGYEAEIINYIGQRVQDSLPFVRFRSKFLAPISKEYPTHESLKEASRNYGRIIVGSDQVWRMFDTGVYMLDWVSGPCSLISYAASFGHDIYEASLARPEACSLLKRFDAISVRENSGVDICRDDFDVPAIQVLDPTFLPDVSEYDKIIESEPVDIPSEPYVCCVFLNGKSRDTFRNQDFLLDIRSKYKLIDPLRDSSGQFRPVAEWLALIKNARYVITDSFHGAAFSLIFNRQFLCLMHDGFNGNARIPSLLESLGVDLSRIAYSLDDIIMESFHKDIDYALVNARLAKARAVSMAFLKGALAREPKNKSPYVPVDAAAAFRCLALNKAEGVSDEEWERYRKWIELRLAETAALSEQISILQKRLEVLEVKAEGVKKSKAAAYMKYAWYKLRGKVSSGSKKMIYKEKASKYKAIAKG